VSQEMNELPIDLPTLIHAYANPYELYHTLCEHDSIYYDNRNQCWLVTSHEAVTYLLGDSRFSAELGQVPNNSPHGQTTPSFLETAIYKQIIFREGKIHQECRAILLRKLKQINKEIPPQIQAIMKQLLDSLQKQNEFDLVTDFSYPYSVLVIAHVLGLPINNLANLLQLARWSDSHGHITSGYVGVNLRDIEKLGTYFRQLIAVKRRMPGDDLISELIAVNPFEHEDEFIANCLMIFSAGRMTTVKLLANGIPLLLQEWEIYRKQLATDADYAENLTEELLRMVTPTRYATRHALEDVDLTTRFPGDHLIRRGDKVVLFLEAANHDPKPFPNPETFVANRDPNRHLAFGYGSHYCPGAQLARLEIQIALKGLLGAFTELYANPDRHPVLNPNPNLGGYDKFCLHAVR
jgi:cytochrome P450